MATTSMRPLLVRGCRLPGSSSGNRWISSKVQDKLSPFAPRHLMSIKDLSQSEVKSLVDQASTFKSNSKSATLAPSPSPAPGYVGGLAGQSVAMIFNKRSTRTRVSTEAAVAFLGGNSMFLGKDDIQLGVNESLHDTGVVISSMVASIVARVAAHSDLEGLAKASTIPVINALSDSFHPLQALADMLTIQETLGLEDKLKVAWVGDSSNVFYDLAFACKLYGIDIAIATPKGYEPLGSFQDQFKALAGAGTLSCTFSPEDAVKGANIIVTDTWISMGQEHEQNARLESFTGFQVSEAMAQRGGAAADWRFMHCLPRHAEEVTDEVFYGPRSLVFPEAENRKWTMISALDRFVVKGGKF